MKASILASLLLVPCVYSLTLPGDGKLRTRRVVLEGASVTCLLPFIGSTPKAYAVESTASTDLSTFQDGPRGLKYLVTKKGDGPTPVRGQKVSTKYTLTINGFPGEQGSKQIDSNTGFLGQPFSVPVGVGMVVKGWDLTLIEMQKGEARRIVIPSELGYGVKGAGSRIPPNTTLYFDIEIIDMSDPPQLKEEQIKWLEENPI